MKLTFGGDVKRTFCTLCPQHCGMLVKVENGRPVRFDGDRNNPVAKGKLCIKGTACIELNEHPDRLNFPLKRVGERGVGPVGADQLGAGARRDRRQAGRHPRPRGPGGARDPRRHPQEPGRLVELALRVPVRDAELRQPGPQLRRRRVPRRDVRVRLGHGLPGAPSRHHEVRRDLGLEPGRVVAAVVGAAQGLPGRRARS